MKTKICNGPTCDNTEWPASEFNKDRSRKDGLAPYCKRCQSYYHRERYKTSEGKQIKLSYNKKFYKTEAGKESRKRAYSDSVKKHPDRRKARAAINNAIARGKLPRADEFQCSYDGCNENAQEYHHANYAPPEHWLDVVPYCCYHHREIDRNNV